VYGILAEGKSDAGTLKVLVRKLAGDDRLPVRTKGYGGSGELLNKGAKDLGTFKTLGVTRFIVCQDADGPDPAPKRNLVTQRIVGLSGLGEECCIVIPVQELEAWILADIECASKIITSWHPEPIESPESIVNPKERLENLSRDSKRKQRYFHRTDNERIAAHLDLKKVAKKCPAFQVLVAFVKNAAAKRRQ
jgi:hypothetical protein